MQLTFASYNIHKAVGNDGKRDPDRILAVLRELDADVIALQECDRRFGARESVIDRAALEETAWQALPVARRPHSLGWHGNALLVRKHFEALEAHAVELPRLEPRGAVRGDFLANGVRLRAVGVHLDLSGLRRRDQVRAIIKHVEACPSQRQSPGIHVRRELDGMLIRFQRGLQAIKFSKFPCETEMDERILRVDARDASELFNRLVSAPRAHQKAPLRPSDVQGARLPAEHRVVGLQRFL